MKRLTALLAALCLLLSFAFAEEEAEEVPEYLQMFRVYHGSRENPRIAITMDDCYEPEYVEKTNELFKQYGITGTFFPLGLMLRPEDKDIWQGIIDSGSEIGTHGWDHGSIGKRDGWAILLTVGKCQQKLDEILGHHYQIQCYRPPYGTLNDENGSISKAMEYLRKFGFQHSIHWDVSQTDPDIAIKNVQNGSILLYHARKKDYECLVKLIPELLEKGFEPVTVSELLGFGENSTEGELFIYDRENYRNKPRDKK